MPGKKYGSRGFTLIELLLTTVIVGVSLFGVITVFSKGAAFINDMKLTTVADYSVQEQMEVIRTMSFSDILSEYPVGVNSFSSPVSGFSRLTSPVGTVTVDYPFGSSSPNDNIIRVTVTVTWTSSSGRQMSKSSATMVTRGGING